VCLATTLTTSNSNSASSGISKALTVFRGLDQSVPEQITSTANLSAMFDMNQLNPAVTPISVINKVAILKPIVKTPIQVTNIVERFSTSDKYSHNEQMIINQAIDILASKIVDQAEDQHCTDSGKVKTFLQLNLATSEREIFAVLYLDNQHHIIAYEEIFIGTVDAAAVYPKEIMCAALRHRASAIIVSHNHPSGILEASRADDTITKKIGAAANAIGLRLLDHIIVSVAGTYSYADNGRMILLDING